MLKIFASPVQRQPYRTIVAGTTSQAPLTIATSYSFSLSFNTTNSTWIKVPSTLFPTGPGGPL
jgi:hypothetical protein